MCPAGTPDTTPGDGRAPRTLDQPQGSLQALADRLADDLQDFDTGMPFAVRFDDRPRCVRGGGTMQHLLNRFAVLVQFLMISPVLVGDLPLFVGDFLPLLKPPQLLVGIDVQPEL